MQFLPKTNERYRAALRLYLQKQLLKHGLNDKICRRIKSLLMSEMLSSRQRLIPTEPIKYADRILGAAVMRLMRNGKRLSVGLSGNGYIKEDRDLFAALLLQASKNAVSNGEGEVSVDFADNDITIIFSGSPDALMKKIIDRLGGMYVTLLPEFHTAILLSDRMAAKGSLPLKNEWEYIIDPLSIVNIMLLEP